MIRRHARVLLPALLLTLSIPVSGLPLVSELPLDVNGVRITQDNFADLGAVTLLSPNAAPDKGAALGKGATGKSTQSLPPRDLLLVLDDTDIVAEEFYTLARHGHLVAHIPLQHILKHAADNHDDCINAVTLLDVFSQHLQTQFHFGQYQRPVLIGVGDAAPFALATLAQAPNRLFQAGVGIGAQTALSMPVPPCPAPGLTAHVQPATKDKMPVYRIETHTLATPWLTLPRLADLDHHLDSTSPDQNPHRPTAHSAVTATGTPIDDLPLVEVQPTLTSDKSLSSTFVILLSGDGGWANIDKDIGEALSRRGLPVVGWNSLQYFWREKYPEQASKDLARAIAHYQATWQRPKVLLIGFSLGADVLPFMISRLPDDVRASIVDTALLSLSHKVDFQFHVTDWLGGNNAKARPIAPELAKLAGSPLLCIYGNTDDDTLCSEKPKGIDVQMLPGDHHFDGNYNAVVTLILNHLRKTQ